MIIIREETPEDVADIRRVNEQAFGQPNESNLVDALRHRGMVALSLVAIEDKQVVGHILFTPVIVESGSSGTSIVAIGPMAVLPEYQNQGIGSQLVEAGLQICRDAGHQLVIVLGHPNYYPRFGFKPARSIGLRCQFDVPDEVFMVKELVEYFAGVPDGLVKYQPEFMTV